MFYCCIKFYLMSIDIDSACDIKMLQYYNLLRWYLFHCMYYLLYCGRIEQVEEVKWRLMHYASP